MTAYYKLHDEFIANTNTRERCVTRGSRCACSFMECKIADLAVLHE